MLSLLAAAALNGGIWRALRGGWINPARHLSEPPGLQTLVLALLSIAFAMYLLDPVGGLMLIAVVVIHEFGHVAAYRVIGHHDARFRLIPLFGGVAISDQVPASQLKSFFVSLMGPGICIAPLVAAVAMSEMLVESAPLTAEYLYYFAILTGALNFLNLLPLWPLDGGRCLSYIMQAFSRRLGQGAVLLMSAALAGYGLMVQSMLLLGFALMSVPSAIRAGAVASYQQPMTRWQAVLALAAWLATAGTHAMVSYWIILLFL